jgi:hypothetical protein
LGKSSNGERAASIGVRIVIISWNRTSQVVGPVSKTNNIEFCYVQSM